ncbi:MAG: hypothetical protein CME64_04475 [Halobacteriovoraceae bacterium]|nr:hypothetical protein [Halobacteriovoraceae bacterium]|tara:strand:- start:174289 stop:174534 length:246 start_codon:yes stop_codon:yes gene_type:complete
MKYFIVFALALSFNVSAKKGKVKYQYKKHEVFDFEALDVAGDSSSPGDLSISPRFRKKFRNKIPERKTFNKEMKRALDSVR